MMKFKQKMLRSTALAGVVATGLSVAAPAQAATVNSITNVQATSIGGTCRISWDESITGGVGDTPTQDFYSYRISNLAGTQVFGVPAFTQVQTPGATSTFSRFIDVTIPLGTQRYDKFITHFELSVLPDVQINQVPIADSLLQAAGGSCLNLRANNEPDVDAGPAASATGQTLVSLTGTASDLENDPLTYQWTQTAGPAVTLGGANTLTPSFNAPPKATGPQVLTFSLAANDGRDTSTDTVDITIIANVGPTANAGPDATVGGGTTGTLDGTGSTDGDGDPLTYNWTQISGPAVTLNGANTANPTFTAPTATTVNQTLVFELSVDDGLARPSVDTVTIAVPDNAAPVVNAGPDLIAAGGNNFQLAQVILSGSATDLENDPLTYQWTQTAGPNVSIAGATTLTPSFFAPVKTSAAQVLTFSLVANDGNSSSTADTVDVTVPANAAPTAVVSPDFSVSDGLLAFPDGAGSSDPDGDLLRYQWTQTGGPLATLAGATSRQPSITPPPKTAVDQVLTFELVVSDGLASSAPAVVNITLLANVSPTADAGPDAIVGGGMTATLDGTGSIDLDGDPLTYNWVQTGGPSVTLNGANTLQPTFTAPAITSVSQMLTFELTVGDGIATASDVVEITIPGNARPVVDAGPDLTATAGTTVTLSGSATDLENDPLTYQWTQTAGPSVVLGGVTTLTPSFTAPPKMAAAQVLTFSLVANDGNFSSAPETVNVTISANIGPQADAGSDATVNGNSTVTLDGSASIDGDGDTLTYSWVQTSGPAVTLRDANAIDPSFTAPTTTGTAQALTFELVVSDGLASSVADSVIITVAANSPPVADAGIDQGPIDSGQAVTLDGSGSTDPDNDALTYDWVQVSGTPVSLTDATSANPTFVAPLVNGNEDLVFQLIVSDGQAVSAADTVTIAIRAVGTITIIQRVIGEDRSFAFTSDVTALNANITTSNGTGQVAATNVSAGSHTVSTTDTSSAGYALTDISCNDTDSVANLTSRTVAIVLSPNEDLVCTFTSANSRDAATAAINNFLTGRNALILSHQPDLQRRLDRLQENPGTPGSATAFGLPVPGSGKLPFNANIASAQTSVSTSLAMLGAAVGDPDRGKNPFDIWAEAYFTRAQLGNQRGDFRIIHTGADYRVSKDLLVGILAEFDDFSNRGPLTAGEAEGSGWMAGPYVMGRIAPQLFGELRAAWGSSDNRVSPLGTFVDDFKTSRSFYSGSLIGQFDIGKNTNIRPELTVRYLSENAKTYTDSLNITVPGQTVGQGDVSFRPRIQHLIKLEDGWSLRPYGEVEGIYTFGTSVNNVLDNGLRARVEGGLDFFSSGSFRASLAGFHDGIGSSNYRSTGVHVSFSFGF